ncbi:hypothetical protein F0562_025486 [Nyssa sinensis]|uniref:Uncharacterized protein n=1 Tax=Nyssa sinensis TaxID=561372 RepID=A0A5J5B867_9ASTE|nr:hypothetical protein F0562_025486 [Nyssa sinensis]
MRRSSRSTTSTRSRNHAAIVKFEVHNDMHFMAALGRVKYEFHNLEAQIQLQLMDAIEAAAQITQLQKDVEVSQVDHATVRSSSEELKKSWTWPEELF